MEDLWDRVAEWDRVNKLLIAEARRDARVADTLALMRNGGMNEEEAMPLMGIPFHAREECRREVGWLREQQRRHAWMEDGKADEPAPAVEERPGQEGEARASLAEQMYNDYVLKTRAAHARAMMRNSDRMDLERAMRLLDIREEDREEFLSDLEDEEAAP